MRSRIRLALFFVVVATVLAGCGGRNNRPAPVEPTPPPSGPVEPTPPPSGPPTGTTLYMGAQESIKTLVQAFAAMRSGDTLVIRDGVYTGPDNVLSDNAAYGGGAGHVPPSGVDGAYTRIYAEHDGAVTFDGEEVRWPFVIASTALHHLEFRGIKWIRPVPTAGVAAVQISWNTGAHHIKWFRCGAMVAHAASNIPTWGINGGEYYLLEECYAWGTARYGFMIADLHPGYGARKVVLRRCVVRMDDVNAAGEPVAAFMDYCAQEVEYQNCLALDVDTSKFRNVTYWLGAFSIRGNTEGYGTARDVHFRGSMALNILGWAGADWYMSGLQVNNQDATRPNSAEHLVLWDVMAGVTATGTSVGSPTLRNLTVSVAADPNDAKVGIPGGVGVWYWGPIAWSIRNSVVIDPQKIAMRGFPSDYNAVFARGPYDFFSDTPPGAHDYTRQKQNEVDPLTGVPGNGVPGLKYLVKAEAGSDLYGTGDAGANRGATILHRYGVPGTFWGESGYDTVTDEPLWPFPYEDQIRADMRTYSPSGGPSGTRGFCAEGQSLSNYIWGYLGHTVPPLGLTASPVAGGSIALSWQPPAERVRSTLSGYRVYRVEGGDYKLVGSVDGNLTFNVTISGLPQGEPQVFVVTAVDAERGESTMSMPVSAVPVGQ